MRSTGYLVLMIAAVIAAFLAFVLFIYTLLTYDNYDDTASFMVMILLCMGLIAAMVFVGVFSFIKYLRKRSGSAVTAMTKACSACGQVMSATEFSCPRCFTLQTDVNQGRGR